MPNTSCVDIYQVSLLVKLLLASAIYCGAALLDASFFGNPYSSLAEDWV